MYSDCKQLAKPSLRLDILVGVVVGLDSKRSCYSKEEGRRIFPTFIDHADTSVNFENIGRTPYLYYVRFTNGILDRDVVRVPLTFTRTN